MAKNATMADYRKATGFEALMGYLYLTDRFERGMELSALEAAVLLPERGDFAVVWRYLTANVRDRMLQEDLSCLSRKISRSAGQMLRPGRLWMCLQVFRERGLLSCCGSRDCVQITLSDPAGKVDLEQSPLMQRLKQQKAGD